MNNLKPFLDAMDGLLSNPHTPALAIIGAWLSFLNYDDWIFSLTNRQFDWFMSFGEALMSGYRKK
jgi:hypothetical protein